MAIDLSALHSVVQLVDCAAVPCSWISRESWCHIELLDLVVLGELMVCSLESHAVSATFMIGHFEGWDKLSVTGERRSQNEFELGDRCVRRKVFCMYN
jgi:hypothetical protein